MNPITVDNFFENPDEIRSYALSLNYRESQGLSDGWLGYRSFDHSQDFYESLVKRIRETISSSHQFQHMRYFFHYSLEETKKTTPHPYLFDEYKIHQDIGWLFAGLIYLYPNPPKNMGTSFCDGNREYDFSIDNKYNRFVCYDAMVNHGPTDFFGHTKEDARLTLTFFCC